MNRRRPPAVPCPRSALPAPLHCSAQAGPVLAGINPVHPGPLAQENTVNSAALIARLTANPHDARRQQHPSDRYHS